MSEFWCPVHVEGKESSDTKTAETFFFESLCGEYRVCFPEAAVGDLEIIPGGILHKGIEFKFTHIGVRNTE